MNVLPQFIKILKLLPLLVDFESMRLQLVVTNRHLPQPLSHMRKNQRGHPRHRIVQPVAAIAAQYLRMMQDAGPSVHRPEKFVVSNHLSGSTRMVRPAPPPHYFTIADGHRTGLKYQLILALIL
ncbi:MAG: hypothetical protein OEN55_06345 [Alphaproteobacteria bacterium]|nr:hypothetical protein [Alphaproteobacteria bacterium]